MKFERTIGHSIIFASLENSLDTPAQSVVVAYYPGSWRKGTQPCH